MTDRKSSSNPLNGRLFIFSGPSGAGKTTICDALLKKRPEMIYSISFTTRAPRSGEQDGIDYHFTDSQSFEEGIAIGRWAEWASVHGHYYGTCKSNLEKYLQQGKDVLLDIDVQGMQQLLVSFPDSITVFIRPPSMTALRQRLEERSTDDPKEIERRLEAAHKEMQYQNRFQHRVVNEDLNSSITTVLGIITKAQDVNPT